MMTIDRDFFKRGYGNKNLVNKIMGELDSLRDKVKTSWYCIGAGYWSYGRLSNHSGEQIAYYRKTMTFEASLGQKRSRFPLQ